MAPRKRKAATDQQTGDVERKKVGEPTTRNQQTRNIQLTNSQKTARQPLGPTRITRGMTTDASRKAVLNTTELLEHIIVHLPARNIFGVQRVCQSFRNVIKTSTAIQEKLFLKPSTQKAQMWELRTAKEERVNASTWPWEFEHHPLKFVRCADDEATAEGPEGWEAAMGTAIRRVPVQLNPLLKQEESPPWIEQSLVKRSIEQEIRARLDLFNVPLKQTQSWRDMLITDPTPPSIGEVRFHWRVTGERGDWVLVFVGSADAKLKIHTLGALVDAALEVEMPDDGARQKYRDIVSNAEAAKGNIARFNPRGDTTVELRGIVVPRDEEWRAMKEKGEVV